MSRQRFADARGLVTGASSGLGRALAKQLARAGARLVVTGRSLDRLTDLVSQLESEGIAPGRVVPFAADLTIEEERQRLLAFVDEQYDGAIDLVVQSAGVGAYGRFLSHDPPVLRRIFEINFFAVAELTRELAPLLMRGRNPSMIVLGSIVARRSLPGRSEYSASKHALAAFVDAVRAEWSTEKIHILLVNPGFTQTSFDQNLLIDTAIFPVADRRRTSAEDVARKTLRALERGRNEVTFSPGGRTLILVHRLFPWFVNWAFGRWTRRLYSDRPKLEAAERAGRARAQRMIAQDSIVD